MVTVKWKFDRGKVYLEVVVFGGSRYYWFPKSGLHKRFHPRQIFTRPLLHKAYSDPILPYYAGESGWKVGELKDEVVRKKLGILILIEAAYYEQLSKAC
jgi:hypothetical protein